LYRINSATTFEPRDGYIDLSFRAVETWDDMAHRNVTAGGKRIVLLLGDAKVGPFVLLAYMPRMDDPMERGDAHGHDSDNWRITLLGESHMGPATYRPGQFRFQVGGQAYGPDDFATGPDGGYHLVMFGDRRGFPIRPVKQASVPAMEKRNIKAAERYGIALPDSFPVDERGLVTNIGVPDRAGKIEGDYAEASEWPSLTGGIRAAAALFGHPLAGPLLLLLRCNPGVIALPARAFDTEILLMVVEGACRIGESALEMGDMRLQESRTIGPPIVAGDEGLSLYVLFADRRGVAHDGNETTDGAAWTASVKQVVYGLERQLASSTDQSALR
jgi:hypothetical protein